MIREEHVDLPAGLRARITYRVAGDGPAVVLLHGWAASWYLWQDTMTALAAAGYRVYAPDHIGCGDSSKPWLFYTPHDYDAYLSGFLAALGLEHVILVGHSLGGHIALSYALNHPQQVERLALVDPAYSPLQQLAPTRGALLLALAGLPPIGELGLTLAPHRLLRWAIGRQGGGFYRPDKLPPAFLDRIVADYLDHASPLVCNSIRYLFLFSLPGLRRLRRDADLWPRLAELAMPALVIWGEHDALLRPSSFSLLASGLPGAVAQPITEAGHTPPMEAPAEFQQALFGFLGRS